MNDIVACKLDLVYKDLQRLQVFCKLQSNDSCKDAYERLIYKNLLLLVEHMISIIEEDEIGDEDVPYLTEEERNYLKHVIETANINVSSIVKLNRKVGVKTQEYICIHYLVNYESHTVTRQRNLSGFAIGEKYKGLKLNKFYTLEELGL